MRYCGFFVGSVPDVDGLLKNAKKAGMTVQYMDGSKIEAAGRPCLHIRHGIEINWYIIEAKTAREVFCYADQLFAEVEENYMPIFYGFF